jgi:hypothetical protein
MVITLMFAWHIAGVLTVMIFVGACIYALCYRRVPMSSRQPDEEHRIQLRSVKFVSSTNSNHITNGDDLDSDSECHYERQP